MVRLPPFNPARVVRRALFCMEEVIQMAKCEVCGKGPQYGHNVSFSKRHTNRQFRPNVMKRTLVINGQSKRVHVCVQCLKTFTKAN